jgi:hypothetical protein
VSFDRKLSIFAPIPLLVGLLTGCYTNIKVTQLQEFHPDSRRMVLLTPLIRDWDVDLRLALAKRGFTLLQYPTQEKVVAQGEQDELVRIYNKAAAHYGLSLRNIGAGVTGSCEVTDLRTDEVVLVVEFQPNGPVIQAFTPLTDTLDKYWSGVPADAATRN